jgi:hypothetical protein
MDNAMSREEAASLMQAWTSLFENDTHQTPIEMAYGLLRTFNDPTAVEIWPRTLPFSRRIVEAAFRVADVPMTKKLQRRINVAHGKRLKAAGDAALKTLQTLDRGVEARFIATVEQTVLRHWQAAQLYLGGGRTTLARKIERKVHVEARHAADRVADNALRELDAGVVAGLLGPLVKAREIEALVRRAGKKAAMTQAQQDRLAQALAAAQAADPTKTEAERATLVRCLATYARKAPAPQR